MEKKRLLVGLMVLSVLAVYGMPATAYVPRTGFADCAALPLPYAPLPTFNIMLLGDPAVYPAPGGYDFCAYLDTVFCSLELVAGLLPEIADFADLVMCMSADINGPLDLELEIPVTPNGILDGAYELGILAAVLNDASHPLHETATAAFQVNFQAVKDLVVEALSVASLKIDDKDLRGLVNSIAPHLTGALAAFIAGFATMGDEQTNAALDELLGLLSDIGLEPPEGGIAAITTPVPQVGPDGDVDGDGFTNRQEHTWFVGVMGYSAADYVAAALDPMQTPPEASGSVVIRGGGYHMIGSDILLEAVVTEAVVVSYAWAKGGLALGEEASTLEIINAQESDSGVYSVQVGVEMIMPDTKDEGIGYLIASTAVNVGDWQLPVGSAFGLAMLAGACALAGAFVIRRRK